MVEYLANFRGSDKSILDLVATNKTVTDVTYSADALTFNGTSSCIKVILEDTIGANDFILNLKYKLTNNTAGDTLIYNGDFQLYNNGSSIIFNIKGHKLYVCDTDTTQHQVTIVRSSGIITVYVDGKANKDTLTCADELSDKFFYLATNNGVDMDVSTDNITGGGVAVITKPSIEITETKHQMSILYPNTYSTFEEIPNTLIAKDINDLSGLFSGCYKLKTVDLSNIDTSNTTYIVSMFYHCQNLERVDVSKIIISDKCTSLNSMFVGCQKLKRVDISNWDTSKVTDMNVMFSDCYSLEQIIGEIDLSSNPTVYHMFYRCNKVTGVKFKNVPKSFDFSTLGIDSSKYTVLNYI